MRRIADETLRQGEPFLSASWTPTPARQPRSSLVDARPHGDGAARPRPRPRPGGAVRRWYHDGSGGFVVADLRVTQGTAETVGLALSRLHDSRELAGRVTELRRTQAALERMTTSLHEEVAAKSVEIARFERDLDSKLRALGLKHGFGNIVGRSPRMLALFDVLRQVADYAVPVLIIGESGTGKELIARALHYESNRAAEPFVAINCAAIPEHLLESELFGFKRGAFTGAHRDKPGLFRAAGAGTLLLDEIGDMPLPLQAKLLRVLQEREVQPIGGTTTEPVEARVVAATKRRLREEVARGTFREDLYYRLNMVEVEVPPLRERLEDVPVLAEHFLERLDQELGLPRRSLSREALRRLMHFDWPGNVRQLENAVQSSAILARGSVVGEAELRLPTEAPPPPSPPRVVVPVAAAPIQTRDEWDAQEKSRILEAMVQSGWNKSRAATILGISRRNLYRKLARHGIEGGD
ncbi:MAG: sigma-54 dependent transcriptional regulator [bacterium]